MKSAPQRSIDDLLREAQDTGASDVHLAPGRPPYFRHDGQLKPAAPEDLAPQDIAGLIEQLLQHNEPARLSVEQKHQADFSYALPDNSRFRVNVFFRLGLPAASLRVVPSSIRSVEELNLPPQLLKLTELKQGFVLAAGPAGHGKSTTLAALLNHINSQRCEHIITIEDPIEYQFIDNKSLIDQREVGRDTASFLEAIRAALRQDPNIVLVGELRDYESMRAALTLAETGHLVFSSLHTNDAAQSVERIIDSFPPAQQSQVRSQLAATLSGVVSQRLLPRRQGGRIPAVEIMVATTAIRAVIRENKIHQIMGIIETSGDSGMQTLDAHLQSLISLGEVTPEAALPWLRLA
ncbi:MAG: type IV pilus twitching motility protein PilT [Candidatus Andersenbacteria bacterium]|nr:type IV pilus twitching motility protein PilT [Candidatus Andersenbacteria bacterium]